MTAAAAAMHLGPHGQNASIDRRGDGIGQRRRETWPASPALKLRVRGIDREVAARTVEDAFPMLLVQRTRAGTLRALLTQDPGTGPASESSAIRHRFWSPRMPGSGFRRPTLVRSGRSSRKTLRGRQQESREERFVCAYLMYTRKASGYSQSPLSMISLRGINARRQVIR